VAPRSRFITPMCPTMRWGAATRKDGRDASMCWRNGLRKCLAVAGVTPA
jgi:hypothetical protein